MPELSSFRFFRFRLHKGEEDETSKRFRAALSNFLLKKLPPVDLLSTEKICMIQIRLRKNQLNPRQQPCHFFQYDVRKTTQKTNQVVALFVQ